MHKATNKKQGFLRVHWGTLPDTGETISPLNQMSTFTSVYRLKVMTLAIELFSPHPHPPKLINETLETEVDWRSPWQYFLFGAQ